MFAQFSFVVDSPVLLIYLTFLVSPNSLNYSRRCCCNANISRLPSFYFSHYCMSHATQSYNFMLLLFS